MSEVVRTAWRRPNCFAGLDQWRFVGPLRSRRAVRRPTNSCFTSAADEVGGILPGIASLRLVVVGQPVGWGVRCPHKLGLVISPTIHVDSSTRRPPKPNSTSKPDGDLL